MDKEERYERLYDAIRRKQPIDKITALAVDQQIFSARKWKIPWVSIKTHLD